MNCVLSSGCKPRFNNNINKARLGSPKNVVHFSGCSSVGLERALWEREVGGSSPLTPTKFRISDRSDCASTVSLPSPLTPTKFFYREFCLSKLTY